MCVCATIEIDRKLAGKVFLVFATIYLLFLSLVLRVLFPLSTSIIPPPFLVLILKSTNAHRCEIYCCILFGSARWYARKKSPIRHMLLLLLFRLFIFRLNSNMHFSWARCAFLPHCPTTPAMPTPQPSAAFCHASSAVSLSLSVGLPPHLLCAF